MSRVFATGQIGEKQMREATFTNKNWKIDLPRARRISFRLAL